MPNPQPTGLRITLSEKELLMQLPALSYCSTPDSPPPQPQSKREG